MNKEKTIKKVSADIEKVVTENNVQLTVNLTLKESNEFTENVLRLLLPNLNYEIRVVEKKKE